MTRSPGPWSRQSLLGTVLAGWGLFNLVEGIDHHHLLQVHHVRQVSDVDNVLLWDLGFLAIGLILYLRGQRRLPTAPTQDPQQHHLQSTQSQRES